MAYSSIEDAYLARLTAVQFPDAPVEAATPAEAAPSVDGMQLAAGPSKTVSDAGNGYGNRPNGTQKGNGWLGPLKAKDGSVMTELTIGVNIDGQETDIPSIVPTLSKQEINHLLAGKPPTDAIVGKAVDHAKERMAQGLSPYADEPNKTGAGAGRGSYAGFDPRLDVANKGAQPEMRAYDPTTRERIASFLQAGFEGLGMDRVKARQNAQTLIGGPSSNLPLDMGIADIVPFLGTGLQTEEAVRMGEDAVTSAKQGNYGTAALQAGGAALGLVPGAAGTAKAAMAVGRAGERLAEKTVPQIMEKGGTMAELLQAMSQGSRSQLTAYHGTPHQFDKFDASKIGTGEGNQTFGFGLYFAENKDVAKGYQSALSGYSADGKRLPSDIGVVISHFGGDVTAAIAERQRQLDGWLASGADAKNQVVKGLNEEINKLSALQGKKLESTGSLYTVDIPDDMVSKMLDFDAPFNKQPKSVQEAIKASGILKEYKANLSDFSSPMMTRNKNMRGENIMQFLEFKLGGPEQVAARLQELGIPGVRYLDAGSRDAGKGSRNIVVFPGGEDQIKILKQEGKK